jgi:polo-like kinase 1
LTVVLTNYFFLSLAAQINFFQDHTKVIICPLMSAVTYIDENKGFRTYRLQLLSKYGCCKELCSRLRYAKTMTERLIGKLEASSSAKSEQQAPTASAVAPVLPTPA